MTINEIRRIFEEAEEERDSICVTNVAGCKTCPFYAADTNTGRAIDSCYREAYIKKLLEKLNIENKERENDNKRIS